MNTLKKCNGTQIAENKIIVVTLCNGKGEKVARKYSKAYADLISPQGNVMTYKVSDRMFGFLSAQSKDGKIYDMGSFEDDPEACAWCVDEKLEDYVTVSNLDVDKRWIRSTVTDVLRDMEEYNDDDLCEYEFLYCDHWEFGGEYPFGCTRTHNQKLWEEMEKPNDAEKATKK